MGIKWNYKWRENIMSKDVENLRKHERVLNMVYKEFVLSISKSFSFERNW